MRFTPIRLLHGRLPILGYIVEGIGEAGIEASRHQGIKPERTPALDAPTHGCLDAFPLAYCTDVSSIPTGSWKHLEGLGTLVIDALRHRHHPTHQTLDQAVHVAERVGARRAYFIHMAHELGHEQTNAALPENMRLAYDGLALGAEIPAQQRWRPAPRSKPSAQFNEG